jgi:Dullard-like phosphatase family protein
LNIRPFAHECLERIKKNYVSIVYTASHQSYADSVLNYLDPSGEFIKYRLYRHNCVEIHEDGEKLYIKDLRIIKNIDLKDMIIIDNSVLSFSFQLENGIPILPYYDNKEDNELRFLMNYLNNIASVTDLRTENKKSIKMDYFLHAAKEEIDSEREDVVLTCVNKDSTNLFNLNCCDHASESDTSLNTSYEKEFVARQPRKRNSIFQEQLINTLDDLKKTFSKLHLERKKSIR